MIINATIQRPADWRLGVAALLSLSSIQPLGALTVFGLTVSRAGTKGDGKITRLSHSLAA